MKGCDFIINQFGKTGEKKKYYDNSLAENNVLKTNITSNQLEPKKTTNNRNSNLLSDYQPKAFKSSYINDNGKWTQKAVNDGFVEFDDYINDIKSDTSNYISFNKKPLKISDTNDYKIVGVLNFDNEPVQYAFLDEISNASRKAARYAERASEKASSKYNDVKQEGEILKFWAEKGKWTFLNLGLDSSIRAYDISQQAGIEANQIAKEFGFDSTEDNTADAYRHFAWNAKMTRDSKLGYYSARNITNRYEYEDMQEKGWISNKSDDFEHLKDNTIIKGKMNQPMLMDLWNNQVGRELANNKVYKDMSVRELFQMAYELHYLITDVNKVYEFLGITDYITDTANWSVDAEWNLTTGVITVKKGADKVSLKIGI